MAAGTPRRRKSWRRPCASINLGAQHLHLARYGESLAEFSRAAGIAGPNAFLLVADPARRDEALGHLELAARSMPAAQATLDRVRTLVAGPRR